MSFILRGIGSYEDSSMSAGIRNYRSVAGWRRAAKHDVVRRLGRRRAPRARLGRRSSQAGAVARNVKKGKTDELGATARI
jgi:hypothetical protein